MLAILDYEAGNLTSVQRAVAHLGAEAVVTRDPEAVSKADRLIFPGVGAAGAAMECLARFGLDRALADFYASGRPLLAICIGSQVIFEHSDEDNAACLGFLPGRVRRFPENMRDAGRALKVPHMGWSQVRFVRKHPLLAGVPEGSEFYFVHSYYLEPADESLVLARSDYGFEFVSAVARGNLAATQFHLEKSGRPGLKIMENFLSWDGKEAFHA